MSPRKTSTQKEAQEPSHSPGDNARSKLHRNGRLASEPHDGWSSDRTISIQLQAGMDGLSIVRNATEHGGTVGDTPYRCSTQKRAARASSWHWAKLTVVENGWSTRSSASTGAVQHLLALKTTRS